MAVLWHLQILEFCRKRPFEPKRAVLVGLKTCRHEDWGQPQLTSSLRTQLLRSWPMGLLKSRVAPRFVKFIFILTDTFCVNGTDCNQVSCKNQLHITFLFYCNFSRNNRKEVNFFFFKLTYGSNSYMLGIACLWRITYENSIATKRYIFLKIMNCSLAVF